MCMVQVMRDLGCSIIPCSPCAAPPCITPVLFHHLQVMEFVATTEGRKIAVHCHAGLGRTGLAIACFFVFAKMHSASAAVTMVRQYRQGALQTSAQVLFVSIFEQYLAYLRCGDSSVHAIHTRTYSMHASCLSPWI